LKAFMEKIEIENENLRKLKDYFVELATLCESLSNVPFITHSNLPFTNPEFNAYQKLIKEVVSKSIMIVSKRCR